MHSTLEMTKPNTPVAGDLVHYIDHTGAIASIWLTLPRGGNISGTYFSFNLNKIISVRFDFTFQQWSYNNHIWTYWTYGARL